MAQQRLDMSARQRTPAAAEMTREIRRQRLLISSTN
jgi:hypothetical protein